MKILKDFNENDIIATIDEWKDKCPPQGKDKQWQDFRSAKENAKYWLENHYTETSLYKNLINVLGNEIEFEKAAPEYELKFDNYGKGRQTDLLIIGNYNNTKIAIGVEAKADEPYDKYIYEKIISSALEIQKNAKSNQLNRIFEIKNKFRFIENEFYFLRYQLAVAILGLTNYAIENDIDLIVLYTLIFSSSKTSKNKEKTNQEDLSRFINCFKNRRIGSFYEVEIPIEFNYNGRLIVGSDKIII